MPDSLDRIPRIGPNAVIQIAAATDRLDRDATRRLFRAAGLQRYLDQPPAAMIPAAEAAALHRALSRVFDTAAARAIARDAGRRTADYLLANRIPKLAQRVLHLLPATLASRILLRAIARNAWTFTGGGSFAWTPGHPAVIELRGTPIARASGFGCDYYAATFERLFRVLVHRDAVVAETACEGAGDPSCRFELRWRSVRARLGVDTAAPA